MKAYQEDLAYIHDVGHSGFTLSSAPGLLGILRRHGVANGLVVDLGCGSGRLARELGRAGYDVLGIDISASMIALARKHAPKGRFLTESFLKVKLPPCDAVISIGECLNYLFDPTGARQRLPRLFRRVYDALRPGGVFVFDVAEPGRVLEGTPPRSCSQGNDWATVVEIEGDRKRNLLTRHITSFRKQGKHYRRSEERHRLRLYRESELAQDLTRLGFRVRILSGYGRFRFRGRFVGFLAQRP